MNLLQVVSNSAFLIITVEITYDERVHVRNLIGRVPTFINEESKLKLIGKLPIGE